MSIEPRGKAPYAPPATVIEFLRRGRERGVPPVVNVDTLIKAGVKESLAPRVLQSLQLLNLINEEGRTTETFDALRSAREEEYQPRLAEWIQSTYQDVFQYVDPTKDGPGRIRDAFRDYLPHGQQERMVTLFLGLCEEAGMVTKDKPPAARTRTNEPARPRIPKLKSPSKTVTPGGDMALPPALAGILNSLPKDGESWPEKRRNDFMLAFGAVLNLLYPVAEEEGDQ